MEASSLKEVKRMDYIPGRSFAASHVRRKRKSRVSFDRGGRWDPSLQSNVALLIHEGSRTGTVTH